MARTWNIPFFIVAAAIITRSSSSGCEHTDLTENNTGSLVTAFIFTYLVCILSAALILFYLIRFYHAAQREKSTRDHNHDPINPVIRNRRPNLVYALNILVVFMNILLFPLAIDFWTLECVTKTPLLRTSKAAIDTVQNILFCAFISIIYGWLILIVLRYAVSDYLSVIDSDAPQCH